MRGFGLIFCALALQASAAQASSPMVEAFKAYKAALNRGDVVMAERQGEKAWRAAEQAGNDKYSAILAYNLAELRLHYLPKSDAATPAARAWVLAQANPDGPLTPQSARLLAALTYFIKAKKRSTRKALRMALKPPGDAGLPISYPVFRAHVELMKDSVVRKTWRDARLHALSAQEAYKALKMSNKQTLASLKLIGASAQLRLTHFKNTDVAIKELWDVLHIMGPRNHDNIHPVVLNAVAWLDAIGTIESSNDIIKRKNGKNAALKKEADQSKDSQLDKALSSPELINYFMTITRPKGCQRVEWLKRMAPKYPADLAEKGYVGAALVMYSLDDKGVPKDVKVAAEVPSATFGQIAARTLQLWRAKPAPDVPVACRTNLLTQFKFVLESDPVRKIR